MWLKVDNWHVKSNEHFMQKYKTTRHKKYLLKTRTLCNHFLNCQAMVPQPQSAGLLLYGTESVADDWYSYSKIKQSKLPASFSSVLVLY